MNKKLLLLMAAICTLGYTNQAQAQTGEALNLDGIATYVDFGYDPALSLQTANFSMEAWVNPAGGSGGQLILFNGACDVADGGWGLSYNGGDFTGSPGSNPGKLSFYLISSTDGNYYQLDQLSSLPIGQWTHVAVTNDGTAIKMYINGVLDNTLMGNYIPYNTSSSLKIGADPNIFCGNNPRYVYNGSIDELRLFNYALSPCQINATMNCELAQSRAGLILYAKFNEGTGNSTNTITTVADSSGNGFDGTMGNFALSGATSNWVAPGAVTSGVACGFVVGNNVSAMANNPVISIGGTATLTAVGATSYTWANAGETTNTIVVSPTVTTTYSLTGTDGTCTAMGAITLTVAPAAAALNFDGANDYVDAGTFYLSSYTKEAWVYSTDGSLSNNVVSSANAPFWLNGGNLTATNQFGGGGSVSDQSGDVFPTNVWTHVAVTYDSASTTMTLYKNGIQVDQNQSIGVIGVAENLQIGAFQSANVFQGNMDEVRIWNRALCASEIQNNMNGELAMASRTGLLAYYKFNQGFDNLDNTAVTALADSSGNAFNGTLNNFALTGSTSNFTAGGAVTTGSMVTAFISTVATQTNVICNGNGDGIASVVATGAASPFTYTWSAGGSTTNSAAGLAAGNYTCTINYACGTTAQTFTITQPDALVASSTAGSILCNGGATTLTVAATGGTGSYTGDAGTFTVTANSYTYTVTDANSCASTTTITVNEPTALVASSNAGTILCNGGATTVTVSATGGTGSYTGDAGTFTVTANSYTYTVTDANSCASTTTITVTQPDVLVASSAAGTILCNGGVTTVTVTEVGGTSPFTNDGTYTVTANSYTYTVTDANSCTSTTTITVNEPTALVASSNAGTILCNGGVTSVTVAATGGTNPYNGDAGTYTNVTANSYTYTVTDGNACASTTTITVTQPDALVASSTAGTILCNGGATTVTVSATGGTGSYNGDAGLYADLPAGSYTYTVIDDNSCSSTTTVTVTQPDALVASASANAIACNGGVTTVTVTETGGISPYVVNGDATSNITAGSYSYTVTDDNGCTSPATITLNDPAAIDASVTSLGNVITATNATATYQWVDCDNSNAPIVGETNQSFTAVSSGNYAVIVTVGSCSNTSACTNINTTGIVQNKTANSLNVYPNPFTNDLTIVSSAKTTAMLFDMLGNKINEFALQNTTQTINVGSLAPGIYYLQVDAQKIKIIKQ